MRFSTIFYSRLESTVDFLGCWGNRNVGIAAIFVKIYEDFYGVRKKFFEDFGGVRKL